MIKTNIFLFLLLLFGECSFAQSQWALDSLQNVLASTKEDTSRLMILSEIALQYSFLKPDSSYYYEKQVSDLAEKTDYFRGRIRGHIIMGFFHASRGDYAKSLDSFLKGLQIAQKNHFEYEEAWCLFGLADVYNELEDYNKAVDYMRKATWLSRNFSTELRRLEFGTIFDLNLARFYQNIHQLDSAEAHFQRAFKETNHLEFHYEVFFCYGQLQLLMGNYARAGELFRTSVLMNEKVDDPFGAAESYYNMANYFKLTGDPDSGIYYAKKSLAKSEPITYQKLMLNASSLLADLYENKDTGQANYYLKKVNTITNELYGSAKVLGLQKVITEEQERQRKIEADRIANQNRLKQYAFLAGGSFLLLIAFILYKNNLKEKKAKKQLQEKNKVIEQTLVNLKSTQAQLIQSEKMASLGELTAGIAHEIQNPLNFVNNFSDVNQEMIDELQTELKSGNVDDAIAISNNIKENEGKINYHGKRADSIVKGMLQHSKTSTGAKEPTDINKLADEYLRLAYHGMRAKDKSFEVKITTDFDEFIGKVNVVSQDIGRVLLNVLNNAFYAVNERKKTADELYQPTVSVQTKKLNDKIEIKVEDNGNGIPQSIVGKIFQPFFTTKPTGQGTGLGLSLAYDIIKAHGGEIKVETLSAEAAAQAGKEEEGTRFKIYLPV